MADLPDVNAPLSDYERALLEKLLSDPTQLPQKFKAWLADYVANNGDFHIDSIPSLRGEEWRQVGASGQPSFVNSWAHIDAARPVCFMKDVLGFVNLDGIAAGGTAGTTIFTLPEGYRPRVVSGTANLHFAVPSNNTFGELVVNSNGEVKHNIGSNVYFSLYGIRFRAA